MNGQTRSLFSPGRVWALSRNTFTELVRLKVFYLVLIFALAIIGTSAFSATITFQDELQMLKDVSLGTMSIFTSVLAIAATAMMLPKDVEDRTLYTILAKPVRRFEYLCGKLGGIMLMLAVATLLMTALFLAVLAFRENQLVSAVNAMAAGRDPADTAYEISKIRASAWGGNLAQGVAIVYVKAIVISAMTLLVSTFATSTIFTILVATAIYFIGHLQGTAREYWLDGRVATGVKKLFVIAVSLVFPDLQIFNLVDDIVAGGSLAASLFWQTIGMGAFYVGIYLLVAGMIFWKKEL